MFKSKPVVESKGTEGNVFMLAGRAAAALKGVGEYKKVGKMFDRILKCANFEEALVVIGKYVDLRK